MVKRGGALMLPPFLGLTETHRQSPALFHPFCNSARPATLPDEPGRSTILWEFLVQGRPLLFQETFFSGFFLFSGFLLINTDPIHIFPGNLVSLFIDGTTGLESVYLLMQIID